MSRFKHIHGEYGISFRFRDQKKGSENKSPFAESLDGSLDTFDEIQLVDIRKYLHLRKEHVCDILEQVLATRSIRGPH